jgi:hypothetical protein
LTEISSNSEKIKALEKLNEVKDKEIKDVINTGDLHLAYIQKIEEKTNSLNNDFKLLAAKILTSEELIPPIDSRLAAIERIS